MCFRNFSFVLGNCFYARFHLKMNPSWKFLQEKIKPCVQKKVKLPKIMNIAFFFPFLIIFYFAIFCQRGSCYFPLPVTFPYCRKKNYQVKGGAIILSCLVIPSQLKIFTYKGGKKVVPSRFLSHTTYRVNNTSGLFNNLHLVFLIVHGKVRLWFVYKGQWRQKCHIDSTSKP